MESVLWLDEIGAGGRDEVGGKAASLARLRAAGFHVPEGFAITTATAAVLAAEEPWPPALQEELLAAFHRLAPANEAVAVRSSAVDEDSAGASFAGQHLTVLGVRGDEELLRAVADCLASLHSEAAAAYRLRTGTDAGSARMAVVVQRMVAATFSGVAFSIDPVTGDRERIVVEAVAGAGEALVSGQAEADRFVLARGDLAIVAEHHPGLPVLTHEQAQSVARAALRAEECFHSPQDIEFAHDGQTLWMLQSRPITTTVAAGTPENRVSEFDTPTSPETLWTSANVGEVFPGLLVPLSMSVFTDAATRSYTVGYRQLRLVGKREEPQWVGLFYNRAFINVDAVRMIAERSFGSSGDAVEHRYLGGEHRPEVKKERSLRLLRFRLASTLPLARMTLGIFRAADRAERAVLARERRMRNLDARKLASAEIEALRQELMTWGAEIFTVHLRASGCAGAGFDMVARAVTPVLKEETEGQLPVLFSGMRDVESAHIAMGMWELSRVALAAGLAGPIGAGTFDPVAETNPATWRSAFAAFLDRHGHRGLNEMEAAARTWRQDPAPVMQVIASYVALDSAHSPLSLLQRQEQERLRLTASIRRRMNPVQRLAFGPILRLGQRWVALRERTKSIAVRAMRTADYLVPECQRRLVEAGAVERPDDIFFLANGELSAFLKGDAQGDFRAAVERRRREYERNRHVVLPERFYGRPVPLEPDLSHHRGEVLTGTPVSPGVVTGRARVILDPATDGPMLPGEVLVAPVTDAGWTPLFALAAGLVVDMGSALSHGSTVAREYGLPAVVNVRVGTRAIRTGDLLLVNGTQGTVTIVEEPED